MIKILLIILAVVLLIYSRKALGCLMVGAALMLLLPLKAFAVIILVIGLALLFGGD